MNYIWQNTANKKAIEILEKNIKNKMLANSYIFSGEKDLGKFSLAKDFARNVFISENPEFEKIDNLLEVNSDFFLIERMPEKKNISIEQIRDLISSLSSSSFLGSYRIVIIRNAEDLSQNSANALLKVLEDFKDKLLIILTVNNLDALPKTIISRSQILNLHLSDFDYIYNLLINNYKASPSVAKNLARLSLGKPIMAIKFLEDKSFYEEYKQIFESLLIFLDSDFTERVKITGDLCRRDLSSGGDFNILEIWQSLIRDLAFLNHGRPDFLQNEFAINGLKSKNLSTDLLLKIELVLKKAREYQESNMSIKAIMEYIAVNL